MLFKKDNKVPAEVKAAGVDSWYAGLDDKDKMILSRYLSGADTSSSYGFFSSIIIKALADENYKFAVAVCYAVYDNCDMSEYERFCMNELLIDAYMGAQMYDDAKAACEENFKLYPAVNSIVLEKNGGAVPEKLNFRNKYIDVIVGIESDYEKAFEMLEAYNKMGILSDEDLVYRRESLKTHRLQRIFDGVYTYRPVGEK